MWCRHLRSNDMYYFEIANHNWIVSIKANDPKEALDKFNHGDYTLDDITLLNTGDVSVDCVGMIE
jgi:hypothetical protein